MFCPSLHTLEGLRPEQAVEAVLAGYRGQTQVRGGVVLVALRSSSREHGVQMARLAARYLQHRAEDPVGVVGLDVAGDEGSFPLASDQAPMAGGVREAALLSIPLTLHAGEWPEKFGSVENLAWAVSNENTRRLGHAVTVRSRPDLADLMVARNITVEVCLTSNIGQSIRVRLRVSECCLSGNGFKVANYSVHPVKILHERGVKFSLSSDNLLLSGDLAQAPSPTGELLHLVHHVGLGWEVARQSVLSGLRAAFSPGVDERFIQTVEAGLT